MKWGLGLGLGFVFLLSSGFTSVAGFDLKNGGGVGNGLTELRRLSDKKQDNCSYTIIIETTCTKGAGTSGAVSLRFGDSSSNDILARHLRTKNTKRLDGLEPAALDDTPAKPFRECATDVFKFTRSCIQSRVCYLYLKQRGDDNWRPGRVQVLVSGAPELSSSNFYFRRFLPRQVWHGFDHCGGDVTPFGIKKSRKV